MARRGRKPKPAINQLSLLELKALYEQAAAREKKRLPELRDKRAGLLAELHSVNEEIDAIEGASGSSASTSAPAPAPAKRRGRPKGSGVKRKPGRPKKTAAVAAPVAAPVVKKAAKKAAKKSAKKVGRPAGTKKAAAKKVGRPAGAKKAAGKKAGGRRGPRTKRGGSEMTLREACALVLRKFKKPMSPQDIKDALLSNKVFTNVPKSFHQQVTGTLSRNPEFKRLAKGKYTL